jgi:hypothetical protein
MLGRIQVTEDITVTLTWWHLVQMAGLLAVILVGMAMVFCFG